MEDREICLLCGAELDRNHAEAYGESSNFRDSWHEAHRLAVIATGLKYARPSASDNNFVYLSAPISLGNGWSYRTGEWQWGEKLFLLAADDNRSEWKWVDP